MDKKKRDDERNKNTKDYQDYQQKQQNNFKAGILR